MVNFLEDGDFHVQGLNIFLRELGFRNYLNGYLQFFVGLVLPKKDLPEAPRAENLANIVELLKFLSPSADGLLNLNAVALLLLTVGGSC